MLPLTLLVTLTFAPPAPSALAGPQLTWHDDYDVAVREGIKEKKDLLIHFRDDKYLDEVLEHADIQKRLANFVLLRVPTSYKYNDKRLIDHPCLTDMLGKPGLTIVSLHNENLPFHREAISVHPLVGSRYGWAPGYGVEQVKIILDLPATASLTQRSMIYAIRVHPERPQSVYCTCHPGFLGHCERHCKRQASMQHQHHADIISASSYLQQQTGGFSGGSEVVAESWGAFVGGENVLEAAFSCVDAWRQSPGHWGAVSRPHRYFGYDIARGANGTWYATGFFGD